MSDPVAVSLDIETYGACETSARGTALPEQRFYHPLKCLHDDAVPLDDLVLTTTLTLINGEPLAPHTWEPGDTFTLHHSNPDHLPVLRDWLNHAQIICGCYVHFDITCLRALPGLRPLLRGRHTLIDLSILNYLHSDVRPERSLKNIGPILHTHAYTRTIKDGRFPHPHDPSYLSYCAEDTHNTVLACCELARRIRKDYSPSTSKLTEYALRFWSSVIWNTIRMTEHGVPYSARALADLEARCHRTIRSVRRTCKRRYSLRLETCGDYKSKPVWHNSEKSKHSFISRLADSTDARDHPLLVYTKERNDISWGEQNRNLIASLLPPSSPARTALNLTTLHTRAHKILSTYINPRLHQGRKGSLSSKLVPLRNPDALLACPTYLIVPSQFKDSKTKGGQQQVRTSAKDPPVQTDPPEVTACRRSRYPGGYLVSPDLSQIELRVAAVLSGDPVLLAAYPPPPQPETDLHTALAVQCEGASILENPNFGCGDGRVDPRQWYKQGNFAQLYGAWAKKLQETILLECGRLLDFDFCVHIITTCRSRYATLREWQYSLLQRARRDGYLEAPLTGASRRFMGGSDNEANEIFNFLVQATAAATMHAVLARLNTYYPLRISLPPRALSCLNTYDAALHDCPSAEAAREFIHNWDKALRWTQNSGFWARLCDLTGNFAPLASSTKTIPSLT